MRYGSVPAVSEVNLVVASGSIATIIGANGAGKSSLLRAIMGLVPLADGQITADGQSIAGLSTEKRVGAGIALSPEGRRLFGDMSVQDNLRAGAYLRRGKENWLGYDLDAIYELFPHLARRRHSLGRTLSGGEQQMCAIGRALMSSPRLLLLDEPSLGLAPLVVREVAKAIGEVAKAGVTVILVEQNSRLALSLSDEGHVLSGGRLVRSAPARELLDDPDLHYAFLGDDPRQTLE
ncbi:ABC transporter ATP-binding protein [Bradyrhizobium sp.]|uniref:ABC transporter ATP-binding protein n=1 Tax=Bradyrhizobium sp. TaxID=376 RepID=UPI0039E2CDE0